MTSLNSVVEARTPLFSHISVPRRSAPRSCSPIVPTKIKFLTSPNLLQIVLPGLYFVIPDTLLLYEMEILEHAILKSIKDDPIHFSVPLDIPSDLGSKLSPCGIECFNGFKSIGNKVFLESANCILVDLNENLYPTSVNSPDYGSVVPLLEASVCLSFLASAVSIDRCGDHDTRTLMFNRIWNKLVNPLSSLRPYRLTKSRLCRASSSLIVGNTKFSRFADDQSIEPSICALLSSFFWMETDLSEFLEW